MAARHHARHQRPRGAADPRRTRCARTADTRAGRACPDGSRQTSSMEAARSEERRGPKSGGADGATDLRPRALYPATQLSQSAPFIDPPATPGAAACARGSPSVSSMSNSGSARLDAEEEAVARGEREARHVEHRMIRHRQAVQRRACRARRVSAAARIVHSNVTGMNDGQLLNGRPPTIERIVDRPTSSSRARSRRRRRGCRRSAPAAAAGCDVRPSPPHELLDRERRVAVELAIAGGARLLAPRRPARSASLNSASRPWMGGWLLTRPPPSLSALRQQRAHLEDRDHRQARA